MHKLLDAQLSKCANIKNTNIVNELKVETQEVDKKIVEVKDTHIFCNAKNTKWISKIQSTVKTKTQKNKVDACAKNAKNTKTWQCNHFISIVDIINVQLWLHAS